MMRTIFRGLLASILVFASVLGLLCIQSPVASANGAPIKIILTYLPDLSNTGPRNATGVAEIVMKEGEVTVDIVGLPPLSEDTYSAWIINTHSNESMSVGRFDADKSDVVKSRTVLPSEIPDKGWNLFLVTVEPRGKEVQSPGDRRSIGGYFPDSVEVRRLPAELPKTGGGMVQGAEYGQSTGSRVPSPTASGQRADPGNNLTTFGAVALAALGLGMLSRMRRKA